MAVCLFSNRSQRTSKCGKNISDTLGCASCATFLFLPHFDVICDLLLKRRTATWNLFVNQMRFSLPSRSCFLKLPNDRANVKWLLNNWELLESWLSQTIGNPELAEKGVKFLIISANVFFSLDRIVMYPMSIKASATLNNSMSFFFNSASFDNLSNFGSWMQLWSGHNKFRGSQRNSFCVHGK